MALMPVYIGFKDDTNARHFAGLNFSEKKLVEAVKYVYDHNCKLHVAINTFAHPNGFNRWLSAPLIWLRKSVLMR